MQLTQIKALVGGAGDRRVVLGRLRKDGADVLHIEDASASVPLATARADCTAVRGFLTEGMCVLAEGALLATGVFEARALAEPPVESAAEARASLQGLSLTGAAPLPCAPPRCSACPAPRKPMSSQRPRRA